VGLAAAVAVGAAEQAEAGAGACGSEGRVTEEGAGLPDGSGQMLYYTIVIGGDHFEYRVYSQLVLLIFITFLWLLNALRLRMQSAALLFALFIVLSWPVPWLHWYATHDLNDRATTVVMRVPMVKAAQRAFPQTPNFVLSYLRAFDQLQFWLIGHSVCMRHQEHKVFYLYLTETLPSRPKARVCRTLAIRS